MTPWEVEWQDQNLNLGLLMACSGLSSGHLLEGQDGALTPHGDIIKPLLCSRTPKSSLLLNCTKPTSPSIILKPHYVTLQPNYSRLVSRTSSIPNPSHLSTLGHSSYLIPSPLSSMPGRRLACQAPLGLGIRILDNKVPILQKLVPSWGNKYTYKISEYNKQGHLWGEGANSAANLLFYLVKRSFRFPKPRRSGRAFPAGGTACAKASFEKM